MKDWNRFVHVVLETVIHMTKKLVCLKKLLNEKLHWLLQGF